MNYVLPDGSLTMAFEKKDIDKRLEDVVKEVLENSNGFALPGWEPERLAEVQTLFANIARWMTTSCGRTWSIFCGR
ncbi:mannonate dehydratase [Klebsiella variicola]|nr:mannonate dehydratase [Klebsiella variicola]